jgi:hypothetical protein
MNTVTLQVFNVSGGAIFSQAIAVEPGSSVQQLLESAVNQVGNTQALTFGMQYFGTFQTPPFGYLVNMFNNIYDAPESGAYWEFYYNGQPAQQGIDSIFPTDGSQVAFQQTVIASLNSAQINMKHAAYQASGDNNYITA